MLPPPPPAFLQCRLVMITHSTVYSFCSCTGFEMLICELCSHFIIKLENGSYPNKTQRKERTRVFSDTRKTCHIHSNVTYRGIKPRKVKTSVCSGAISSVLPAEAPWEAGVGCPRVSLPSRPSSTRRYLFTLRANNTHLFVATGLQMLAQPSCRAEGKSRSPSRGQESLRGKGVPIPGD